MQAFYGTKEYTLIPKVVAKTSDDTELLRLRRAMDDYNLLSPQPTPPETILTKPQVRGSESEPRHQPTFDNRNCITLPQVLEHFAQQVRDLPMRTRPLTATHAAEETPQMSSPTKPTLSETAEKPVAEELVSTPPQLPIDTPHAAIAVNMDVRSWLTDSSPALARYAPVFVTAGYDDTALLKGAEEDERQELLEDLDKEGIRKGHRRNIERMLLALGP